MSPPISTPFDKPRAPHRQLGQILVDGALAWAIGGLLAAVAGVIVMQTGLFDVSATTPHNPIVAWVLHNTMIHSVQARASSESLPRAFSPAQTHHGLELYQQHCAECHGGPGIPRATWTVGLTPTPPFLLDAARNWSPQELDRIVSEGVKMSAMPGWSTSLSRADIQAIVAALEAMPDETEQSYCEAISPGQARLDIGCSSAVAR